MAKIVNFCQLLFKVGKGDRLRDSYPTLREPLRGTGTLGERSRVLLVSKGREPLTTFSRATGSRSFWHRKVESPWQLFHGRRDLALFGIKRSRALDDFFTGDGISLFLTSKGREPLTTFSRATGSRSFWYRKVEILYSWILNLPCDQFSLLSPPF